MSLISKAKEHWSRISSGSIDIPEWDEVLHFKRMTLEEIGKWQKQLTADPMGTGVKIIVDRVTNADGEKLFPNALEDYSALMAQADPKVIERIAVAIMAPPTAADATKN
jgi:hypothetical protein